MCWRRTRPWFTATSRATASTTTVPSSPAGKKFINCMKLGNPLLLIEFGINCEKDVMDEFKKLAKKRKKKKKKKKKGKKKKK
jgi:hypothetical protein